MLGYTVEADGVSIPVVLFVQPHSSQPCLLGMNAAPALYNYNLYMHIIYIFIYYIFIYGI